MEKIEEVAKRYGVNKIYAKKFDGNVIVNTSFLVDASRKTDAYNVMYDVLENPKGYTEKDFEDEDILIYGTNRVYYKELGIIDLSLIYDNGVWYYAD